MNLKPMMRDLKEKLEEQGFQVNGPDIIPTPVGVIEVTDEAREMETIHDDKSVLMVRTAGTEETPSPLDIVITGSATPFDLTTNELVTTEVPNPSAGTVHRFKAYRLRESPGPKVTLVTDEERESIFGDAGEEDGEVGNGDESAPTVLSLFTGAGGLDLGFEAEGFSHLDAVELDSVCVSTLRHNRPDWNVIEGDVRKYKPKRKLNPDVLLAGFPCQGFSLGGNRDELDTRNLLYKEVIRVASESRPRVVVLENVLNLRTMKSPESGKCFADQIADELRAVGYSVFYDVFKVCHYDVPQTRRRFVFIGFRGQPPRQYHLPRPGPITTIREALYDLAQGQLAKLPNHNPVWGFKSAVHVETGKPFDLNQEIFPVRFSRTASDGHPIRNFDEPFPAIDTATIWGWAQGHLVARRVRKDRVNGKFIRNPEASVTLWRVSASRLRSFTDREYARLQTFPDDWEFIGNTKRDIHLQIGNAVPVKFAKRLAQNVKNALEALREGSEFKDNEYVKTHETLVEKNWSFGPIGRNAHLKASSEIGR